MRPTPHTGHCVTGLPPIVSTVAAHNAMSVSRHTPCVHRHLHVLTGLPHRGHTPLGGRLHVRVPQRFTHGGGWIEPGMGAIDHPLIAAHPLRPVTQHHAHLPKPIECAAGTGQPGTGQIHIRQRARPVERHTLHPVEPGFREVRAVEVRATHPHPIPFGPCQVTELQWDRPQIAVDPNPFHQIRAYR